MSIIIIKIKTVRSRSSGRQVGGSLPRDPASPRRRNRTGRRRPGPRRPRPAAGCEPHSSYMRYITQHTRMLPQGHPSSDQHLQSSFIYIKYITYILCTIHKIFTQLTSICRNNNTTLHGITTSICRTKFNITGEPLYKIT